MGRGRREQRHVLSTQLLAQRTKLSITTVSHRSTVDFKIYKVHAGAFVSTVKCTVPTVACSYAMARIFFLNVTGLPGDEIPDNDHTGGIAYGEVRSPFVEAADGSVLHTITQQRVFMIRDCLSKRICSRSRQTNQQRKKVS